MNKMVFDKYHFTLFTDTLDSGLKVYFVKKTNFYRKQAQIHFDFGSMVEKYQLDNENYLIPLGTAHLMEHMLFNLDEGDASVLFEQLGASDNAYTSKRETSFYFSTIDNFDECLKLLISMCFNPHFTKPKLDKERPIVENEIRMYEDNLLNRVDLELFNAMYENNPFKHEIAGTVDTIKEVDSKMLKRIHKHFYNLENAYITIIGDFDENKLFADLEKLTKKYKRPKLNIQKEIINEPKTVKTKEVIVESDKISKATLQLIYKCDFADIDTHDKFKLERTLQIMVEYLYNSHSKIEKHLEEKGLFDNSFGYVGHFCNEAQFFGFYMQTLEIDKVLFCYNETIQDILNNKIDSKEIERIKRQMITNELQTYDSFDGLQEKIDIYHLNQIKFDEILSVTSSITAKDVEQAINMIDFNNFVVMKLIPKIIQD